MDYRTVVNPEIFLAKSFGGEQLVFLVRGLVYFTRLQSQVNTVGLVFHFKGFKCSPPALILSKELLVQTQNRELGL